ncbi:uracil-DNA glycosylase [Sulfurospirillum arcachonense]|uniref:uracil-DNA glycosylase n=1 Tax=Sulfurospirillum arcachonense TaxID=57666 RepID=UPI0004695C4A|nr:uracil-DNA glycosylase [Sulfurospirillum arcachonense]
MTQIEKARLLKILYQYRAMGFEYFKEYKPVGSKDTSSMLPKEIGQLKESVMSCHLCNLSKTRKNVVFGEGDENAKLMFIGEAPGASEDEDGKVFVGRSGTVLTNIIENVLRLKREDVYIANIVKCRPPGNRVPTMEEVSACKPYLMQQVEKVNPSIIVALGSTSFHHLTGEYETEISKIRGEVLELGNAKLIPTYHPNFLLRNPSSKKEVFQDMLKVKSLL